MKIKVFIVTYNHAKVLNRCLKSLEESDLLQHDYEVVIINNHTNFSYETKLPSVKVLHNMTRPDFAGGHLARDWNAAIIHGFESLESPKADIVICSQNDTVFLPGWVSYIESVLPMYDMIQFGKGDQCFLLTPECIRKVGLFDERCCNTGHHEADYFIRSCRVLKERCSIKDIPHGRFFNPIENYVTDETVLSGAERRDEISCSAGYWHPISLEHVKKKWGDHRLEHINPDVPLHGNLPNPILYPYFECNREFKRLTP